MVGALATVARAMRKEPDGFWAVIVKGAGVCGSLVEALPTVAPRRVQARNAVTAKSNRRFADPAQLPRQIASIVRHSNVKLPQGKFQSRCFTSGVGDRN